jgi:hypothetical protein
VLGFGAGIGRIGPYAEQGNIYRGGALQLLFASWFKDYIGSSGPGADQRPTFPSNLTPEDKTRLSKLYSLRLTNFGATKASTADLMKFYSYLPDADLIRTAAVRPTGTSSPTRRERRSTARPATSQTTAITATPKTPSF